MKRRVCRHPQIVVHPDQTQVLLSLKLAKIPRDVATAPSCGSMTKPAQQRLTSRTVKGMFELTPVHPGPKPCCPFRPTEIPTAQHSMAPLCSLGSQEHLALDWDPRMPLFPERETSLARETHGPVGRPSETKEDIPCLAFLWASSESLLPSTLPLHPVPSSGLACSGGRGPQRDVQSQFLQTLGPSQAFPQLKV